MTTLERHPPERRAKRGVIVACPGSCCCCCCCLHTLGGIIGASLGARKVSKASVGTPSMKPSGDPRAAEASVQATRLYWQTLAVLCGLIAVVEMGFGTEAGPVGLVLIVGGTLLLALPAVQVMSSAVCLLMIARGRPSRFPDKSAALKRIGSITLATIAGAILGIIAMWVLALIPALISAVL